MFLKVKAPVLIIFLGLICMTGVFLLTFFRMKTKIDSRIEERVTQMFYIKNVDTTIAVGNAVKDSF